MFSYSPPIALVIMLLSGINGCVYKREPAEMLLMCGYPDVRTMSIAAIQKLNDAGCRTWVSIEPYPTPNLVRTGLAGYLGRSKLCGQNYFW